MAKTGSSVRLGPENERWITEREIATNGLLTRSDMLKIAMALLRAYHTRHGHLPPLDALEKAIESMPPKKA